MKQKKIVIIMAGILTAAAAMTGCAEQNKTATQVDYTQNAQGKSEQTKQKTAEKSQPDKKQVNKSTSGGKENSNQTAENQKDKVNLFLHYKEISDLVTAAPLHEFPD